MRIHLVGCNHRQSSVAARERLAFSPEQTREALCRFHRQFPDTEAVLLSTCNRTEIYTASADENQCPSHQEVIHFLADFHGLPPIEVVDDLFEHSGDQVIRHLFTVAASLDSMVVGEAQILSQVKQAYQLATSANQSMPLTHAVFQKAIYVAKRITTETSIQQKRISIPSVAVADFASQIFERFDDKSILVIGAGEMAEETLNYLIDAGARKIRIVSRNQQRSQQLAERVTGSAESWDRLTDLVIEADLIISITGATEPIFTLADYKQIERQRLQRTLFILDLAVPRDFDPRIKNRRNIYLYSIDDLKEVCQRNQSARQREWPKAEKIIEQETVRFMKELNHRATGPTIRRLKQLADEIKSDELQRLMNKLEHLDTRSRDEIERSFDRLINKILHPPLESLRDESVHGTPHGLLDALRRLFQLKD